MQEHEYAHALHQHSSLCGKHQFCQATYGNISSLCNTVGAAYTALKQDLLAREFAVVLSNIGKIGKLLSFKLTSYIIRVICVYAKQKHPG